MIYADPASHSRVFLILFIDRKLIIILVIVINCNNKYSLMGKQLPELSYLREQGYRLTPQRLAILEVLKTSTGHLTPAEIYQQVAEQMPGMTEATVYRTLNFLAGQNLILVAHLGKGQLVYEYAENDHHHLICTQCGDMQEIGHEQLEELYKKFSQSTGYQIHSIHTTFFGYCPECLVAISKEEEKG
jgi:Fe2+ or Zn2+ uptake regulation protein